jgi:hypothetical protein
MKASEHGIPHVQRWYWTPREDDERWKYGPFSDKHDAILDGQLNTDGAFYVGSVSEPDVTEPTAEEVLRLATNNLYDDCGEVAEDCFEADAAARAELNGELRRVFAEWLTKHGLWPTCGLIENIERIELEPEAE